MAKKKKVAKVSPNKSAAVKKKKAAPEAAVSTAATGELAKVAKAADETIKSIKIKKNEAKANVEAMAKKVEGPKAMPGKSLAVSERKGPLNVRSVRVKGTAIYLTVADSGNTTIEREVVVDEDVMEELHAACGKVLKTLGVTNDEDDEEDEWEEVANDDDE